MARFLNAPEGNSITSDPTERFDWSGLSMLAERARQSKQIRSDRQMLRQIMGLPAEEEASGLRGVMSRLGGMFGIGQQYQPMGELSKLAATQRIKQLFPEKPEVQDTIIQKVAKTGIDSLTVGEKTVYKDLIKKDDVNKKLYVEYLNNYDIAHGWKGVTDKTKPKKYTFEEFQNIFSGEEKPATNLPGSEMPHPTRDPKIVQRIQEGRSTGVKDSDMAQMLKDLNIDPLIYDLK